MLSKIDLVENFPLDFHGPNLVLPAPLIFWTRRYVCFKYACDKGSAILCLPFICFVALILCIFNPLFNPGPLLFSQDRMGMGGRRFTMWKFRTMSLAPVKARAYNAPLEVERITVFARYLRKFRIDELPNFFSVLSGDMSLVGPRPDAWDHSTVYAENVGHYSDRFRGFPCITGLAQGVGGTGQSG